ncbi:MAG: putative DNA binding domain-containing protein [Verrucomicrobia bacterium]|nr:putative DNA binding domain-containing protein [Verrucomicrobiota bacterium]MCH8513657.1 putative DNA binding domain-containing protein [Kiritimatiellia bacterium]
MSMIPPRLQQILDGLEDENCEFKEWKTKDDFDGLTKYTCALANEGGGKMVIGVSDKRPRRIVGTRIWPQMEVTRKSLNRRIHLNTQWEEIITPGGRVLVITVPRHAYGLPAAWDGRAWMRENDSLVPLTEARRKEIWEEVGKDFSAEICPGLSIGDLKPEAIEAFRGAWVNTLRARREEAMQRDAERVERLQHEQLLRDTELLNPDGTLVNAALILFGTRQAVRRHLAQAELIYEFRNTPASGPADLRLEFQEGFFSWYDLLWQNLNEPSRNPRQTFQTGLFVRQLPSFAERPVREAILNAVCHRDYLLGNSVFLRHTPTTLIVESPGGLLPQVTVETLLDRQATRNRRLAEIFQRCGMVERSGQGMNLIYEDAITSAKQLPTPDAAPYQFKLSLHGVVQDPSFLAYLERVGQEKMRLYDTAHLLVLDAVRRDTSIPDTLKPLVDRLVSDGLLERVSRGRGSRIILSRTFSHAIGESAAYTRRKGLDQEESKLLLHKHLVHKGERGALLDELGEVLPSKTKRQVQHLLRLLAEDGKATPPRRGRGGLWKSTSSELQPPPKD